MTMIEKCEDALNRLPYSATPNEQVRAVLQALREPSDDAMKALFDAFMRCQLAPEMPARSSERQVEREMWQAAIDFILSEQVT